jgi:hypothetical protein
MPQVERTLETAAATAVLLTAILFTALPGMAAVAREDILVPVAQAALTASLALLERAAAAEAVVERAL